MGCNVCGPWNRIRDDEGTKLEEQGNKAWRQPVVTRQIYFVYAAGLIFAFQKRKYFSKLGWQCGIINDKKKKKNKERKKGEKKGKPLKSFESIPWD